MCVFFLFWTGWDSVSKSIKHITGFRLSRCTRSLGSVLFTEPAGAFGVMLLHAPLIRCAIHLPCWWGDKWAALGIQVATWKWLHVQKISFFFSIHTVRMVTFIVLSGKWLIYDHNDSKLLRARSRKRAQCEGCARGEHHRWDIVLWNMDLKEKGQREKAASLWCNVFLLINPPPPACFYCNSLQVKSSSWHLTQCFSLCFFFLEGRLIPFRVAEMLQHGLKAPCNHRSTGVQQLPF